MGINQSLVSIIVPVFNAAKYISHCLDSILNSNYQNIEIIIIDDGSSDDSLSIINEYKKKDTRIKVFSQENKGSGQARNKGIENASGDYVLFVDADDVLCSSAISISVDLIEHNDVDVVMFNYETIQSNYSHNFLEKRMIQDSYDLEIWSYEDFWKNYFSNNLVWCVVPWGKLYKKKLFQKIRYKNKYYEDEYILNELINKNISLLVLNETLYLYRVHGESMMSRPFSERYLDKTDCFIERLNLFIKESNAFIGDAATMLIHSCNILKRYISVIGNNAYNDRLIRAKELLKKALGLSMNKSIKKKISVFMRHTRCYYLIHYSSPIYKLVQLTHLLSKIKYYFQIKRSLKVISECLIDGYYELHDGYIKLVNKPPNLNFKIFHVRSKKKKECLFDAGKLIKTKYKIILICETKTFYFVKNKKRYLETKSKYNEYKDLLNYPTMSLSFFNKDLLIVGETIKGDRTKRNERFNLILDYLFNFYSKVNYSLKRIQINNHIFVVPYCVQHGDLKDSNIIWDASGHFRLIDLEAIGEKPVFYDLFFYILISKKEQTYSIFQNDVFLKKLSDVASKAGINSTCVDDLLLIYLDALWEGYMKEQTKSYFEYYLKNLLILISADLSLVKCREYLNYRNIKSKNERA